MHGRWNLWQSVRSTQPIQEYADTIDMTLPAAQRLPATTAYRLLAGESVHLAPTAKQPVDYTRVLGNHRVLYCGENHWDLGAKADLTKALPALRQAGITHLGIEMYFADREMQEVLDTHFERRDVASLRVLRQGLRYFGNQYGCAPAYERLVTTAIAHGIRVVGINDWPTHRGLANAAWAATIADVLAGSDDAQMIVYGGMMHMGHHVWSEYDGHTYPLVNVELARRGYTGPVLHYAWNGLGNGHVESERSARSYAALASVGACDEQYMLALEPPTAGIGNLLLESDENHAWPDFLIHPATPLHGSDSHDANADLGLPDDAHWAQRWRTFLTQWWERYVERDDPDTFGVGDC